MKYDAFISYSHDIDTRLAEALQDGLRRITKPWYRRQALNVFRDSTGLSANPGLWSSITEVMDDSEFLVLLCSPHSAASPWVGREIEHWRATKPAGRILPVLTAGELVWDEATRGFDPERSTAANPALAGAFSEEPLYVDLAWAHTEEHLTLRNPGFQDRVADLAAPMHGLAKDELVGRDIHEHRRTLRFAWGAAIALVLLSIGTVTGLSVAVAKANEARNTAEKKVKVEEELGKKKADLARVEVTLGKRENELDQRLQDLKATQGTLESTRGTLETTKGTLATTKGTLATTKGDLATTKGTLATTKGTLETTKGDLATTRGTLQTTQGDLQTTRGDLQTTQGDLQTTLGNLQTTQGDLQNAKAAASAALVRAERATSRATDAVNQATAAAAVAKTKTLEAKSIDLALRATDPDRLHGDLQLALLLGREAARLDEQSGAHSPTVRGALLELGLETSRGLRRFLQVPDTSSTGGPQPIVVMRNGRVAYGSLTTDRIVVFNRGSSRPTRDIDAGGPVLDVALGADNDVLVAQIQTDLGSDVRLWNLASGAPGEVLCSGGCAFTVGPGGRTIAVTGPTANLFVDGNDPGIRIPFVGTLGTATGDVTPPPPPGGPPGLAVAAAIAAPAPPGLGSDPPVASPFGSDGRWVLGRAPDAGNGLVLWDLAHGANRIVLDTVVGGFVDDATFDPSGTALAVAVNGTSVARVELSDTPSAGPVTETGSTVTTVGAASDGAVAAATSDGRVVYVGASNWEWSPSIPTPITTLAFSPKGKVLAAGNDLIHFLTLLDTTDAGLSSSARIVGTLPGARRAWFSSDETVAFLETVDLTDSSASAPVALTVLALGRQANGPIPAVAPTVIQVVDGRYRQFEQTPDASLLVGVGDRADVFRLDSSAWIRTTEGLTTSNITAETWGRLAGSSRVLADMAIDGDSTVVAVSRDGFGAVWDARDFAPGTFVDGPPPDSQPPPFGVESVTSPDLRFVARSTGTGIELLDRATGQVARTLEQPGNQIVVGMRFSPSGSYLLTCTGTPQTCEQTTVWRAADGALVAQLAGIAVVSGDEGTVAHWDASAGRIEAFTTAALEAHAAPFRTIALAVFPLADTAAVALDGDGSRLAITNGWMHFVWDTATGKAVGSGLGILPGPDAASKVNAVLSANGLVLAVQGADGGVQIWDLGVHPKLRGELPATLHSSELALNADGSLLATDNPVRVWDTKALRQIGPTFLESHATTLQILPGTGTLLVGLGDGPDAAELFTLDRTQLLHDACRLAGRLLTKEEWTAFGIPLPVARVCP